jgi:hypothetical protein
MSDYLEANTHESRYERRRHLIAEIARQRAELGEAYRGLHKPIELGESGLRAFGFLRENAWIFTAIPASLNLVTFLFGLKNMVMGTPAKAIASERHALERELEKKRPKSLLGHAAHWGGHGWRVYKIYRRVKKYLPVP